MVSTLRKVWIFECLLVTIIALPIPIKPINTFSIATYNAFWLFNPTKLHQAHPACPWKDEYSAHKHIEDVASVMREVNADIWVLQEVQDRHTLSLLSDKLDGTYEGYLEEGADHNMKMNVAILSRYSPSQRPFRIDKKYTYSDGKVIQLSRNLVAKFSFPPINFTLIGLHLKMPRPGKGLKKQISEINLLVEETSRILNHDEALIIAGDFNDVDLDYHLAMRKCRKRIHIGNSCPTLRREFNLKNSLSFVDPIRRYTTSDYLAIDHILLSDCLLSHVKRANVYNQKGMFKVSDHCPLKIDFQFKE